MTKYELLQESVSDYLFEESVGYLTEGATLDMNKKLRELQAKYRETVKDIKVSYKEKDYKAVEKKCDDLLDIIDKYEKEIDDIDDSLGSVICGAMFQSIMSDVKAFLVGIPTCGVGTVVSYVKDVIDMAMGIIKQLKSDGDVTINVLNARRAKIKGLIVEMKKGIENYKKELLENLKSKIKEDEDNEQKEVKESAMIRLAIYESCHAGEITEEERDTLLALV